MSLTIQFNTMIAMVVMGGWLGAALDTYGRFLKRPKRSSWVVFINDILFWIVQALLCFYVLLMVNEGELRFYILLALLCGFAAYQSLFKSTYVRLLEFIIKTSIRIYQLVRRLVIILMIRPIKALIQLIIVALVFLFNVIIRVIQFLVKIILLPLKWIFLLIWRILPQNLKIFFINKAGFFVAKKNSIVRWWKNMRNKRK